MGGTVSEDYGGLDDDDEEVLPTIAARTRGSIARRVDAACLMLRGSGASDGPGAAGTDARATAPDAELSWFERIKLLYDVGDGSDERVAEILDAIKRTEGELASAEITDIAKYPTAGRVLCQPKPQEGYCAPSHFGVMAYVTPCHVGLTPCSLSFALRRCSSQPHTRTERRYIQTG